MRIDKPIVGMMAIIGFVSFVSLGYTNRKTDTDISTMVAEWERAKTYTQDYLNVASDEAINFKPTPEMRTFGQQFLHLAEANYGFAAAASETQSPITFGQLEKTSDQYNTKESLTRVVMQSYDFTIAALKVLDETKIKDTISLFNFELTREAVFRKAFEHQTHHRGQATVYLRLKGIKPPDERLF
jgi:uncharacterized damage-inducible protein DinB